MIPFQKTGPHGERLRSRRRSRHVNLILLNTHLSVRKLLPVSLFLPLAVTSGRQSRTCPARTHEDARTRAKPTPPAHAKRGRREPAACRSTPLTPSPRTDSGRAARHGHQVHPSARRRRFRPRRPGGGSGFLATAEPAGAGLAGSGCYI